MNVLIVNYYRYDQGGAGISTFYLIQALKEMGYNIFVASTEPYPGFESFIFKRFRLIPIFQLRDLYVTYFLSKVIKKKKIDIIHSTEERFTAVGTVKAAKKNNIPCVLHFRGFWFCCLKGDLLYKNISICNGLNFFRCLKCLNKFRIFWEVYKYLYFKKRVKKLNKADVKIAVSNVVRSKLKEKGINENVRTIYNPISLSLKKINKDEDIINIRKENKILVSFIGKVIYHRGIKNFLKVAKLVLEKSNNINFTIIGDGEMRKYCQKYINDKKIDNIFLINQIAHEKIDLYYQQSDIIFFPTILPEPFGRVIIEAMAHKCVVVASNLGAAKEIIKDGVNGFLVNPYNYSQCMERILVLANDNNLRRKIGEAGFLRAKDFADNKIAQEVSDLYKNSLNSKH